MNNIFDVDSTEPTVTQVTGRMKPSPVEIIHVRRENMDEVGKWVRDRGGIFNSHFMGCLVSWNGELNSWPSVVVKRDWVLVYEQHPKFPGFKTYSMDEVSSLYDIDW